MSVSLSEAREIATEAYVFFQGMIDQYRLKKQTQIFENRIVVTTNTEDIPFPYQCKDQAYGNAFLNLLEEPLVLSVPAISSDLFFSTMCCDQYSHNFAYFGSITTGNDKADYLIAGPDWVGSVPGGITQAVYSEGNFVTMILRLEIKNPEDPTDVEQTAAILKSCILQPLSDYTGGPSPPDIPTPTFPQYKSDALIKPSFFEYINIFSNYLKIYPTEVGLYSKFAKIGVIPGDPFPPANMDDATLEAIAQGVWEGNTLVESELRRQTTVNNVGGWIYVCGITPPLIGDRQLMEGRYLARAGMARSTFEWGNDKEQAIYMQSFVDKHGDPLCGGNIYRIRWSLEEQPSVKSFWSITMYHKNGLYVKNPIDRYQIGSNTPGLVYAPNRSLVIYIQSSDPSGGKSANWLPCPSSGEFQIFLRNYWPKDVVFQGTYSPPLPVKV